MLWTNHDRPSPGASLALAALTLLGLVACGRDGADGGGGSGETDAPTAPGTYPEPPNVLLVTIDTLRADHLGCYGYWRPTSPNIDALAAESVFYEDAIATSGTTLPSHLSIMTGLYPHQHGFVANKGAVEGKFRPAPGRRPAAEVFQEMGYVTAGFVSGSTVKKTTGIQHGFETWNQPSTLHRVGVETTEHALEWLELYAEADVKRPFFVWVHLWDTHEPNDPPEPYASMFQTDARLEEMVRERRIDADRIQEMFSPEEIARLFFPELLTPILRGEEVEVPRVTYDDVLRLHNLYDGDVFYVDERVGELLGALARGGLAGETVVALASDHGQALGQHDWLEHGRIQGENVRVPMMIRFPGALVAQPLRVERVVSLVDLMPTILARVDHEAARDFLKQSSGEDTLDSRSLRQFAFSHRAERDRDHWEPGRKFGLTLDRWKYYHVEEGEVELFDLAEDPGELNDVAEKHAATVERLRARVREILASNPAGLETRGSLSNEEREELERELRESGYLGADEDG